MSRESLARAFLRWLDQLGGVGSVADVLALPGARHLAPTTVARYASEAEARGLVSSYPGLTGEGVQYVVGGRRP